MGRWGLGIRANPAGGFLSFYFAENTLKRKPYEVTMYLQIELGDDENRLTVRLCERRGPGVRAPLMYEVLELLNDNVRQAGDIEIEKAGRFRGGASGAVAEVTIWRRGEISRPEGRRHRRHGRNDAAS